MTTQVTGTISDKLKQASYPGAVFLVMSLPQVYGWTNSLFKTMSDCPTWKTKLVHTLVFAVLVMLVDKYVRKSTKTNEQMLEYALTCALVFFFVSSQEMYMLTHAIYPATLDQSGCPTGVGVIVHTILYVVVLAIAMNIKSEYAYVASKLQNYNL